MNKPPASIMLTMDAAIARLDHAFKCLGRNLESRESITMAIPQIIPMIPSKIGNFGAYTVKIPINRIASPPKSNKEERMDSDFTAGVFALGN